MKWLKNLFSKLWTELKDWHNLLIFVIVFLVLSSEVWVMYLLYFITGNGWFLAAGSACWGFWLLPGTPFLPLCIAITFSIRKIVNKIKARRKKNDGDSEHAGRRDI